MLKWNGGGNTPTLNMKKYKILQDTMANGSKVHAGDIVELNEVEGHSLCAYHKAEIHVILFQLFFLVLISSSNCCMVNNKFIKSSNSKQA